MRPKETKLMLINNLTTQQEEQSCVEVQQPSHSEEEELQKKNLKQLQKSSKQLKILTFVNRNKQLCSFCYKKLQNFIALC